MKTFSGLLCLALALAWPAFAAPAPATDKDTPTLSVVTLNLYHDKLDWPKRRTQIVQTLRELHPDAIALEEVLQHDALPNQAQWLAEQLGYAWYFTSVDPPGAAQRYGNALLTRRPILAREQIRLKRLDDSRTAGRLRLDVDGRAVNLYVTHLHWTQAGGALRERQLQDLLAWVEKTADGAPSLLAGDFNASADAPQLAALRAGFDDSYGSLNGTKDRRADSTLNPKFNPPKRIDHVFFQRARFEPVSSRILFQTPDANGIWASDHFGLVSTLRLAPSASADAQRPWADRALAPDRRAALLVQAMTQDEKFQMLHSYFGLGKDGGPLPPGALGSAGFVPAIERLGIAAQQLADAGVGVTNPGNVRHGDHATALPSGPATAATWNRELAYAGGATMGREAWQQGFNVLLAGSVNLQRDPRNGRNFEYAGEDPLLAGVMVGESIRGVQSQHVVSTMKHFAMNDLETGRNTHSADIGAQAMHESDLLAFELALQIGEPGSVMCSYNRINGIYGCEHDYLLNQVLKQEWKFPGYVMSDWGGVHSGSKAALAGLDQQSAGEVFDKAVYFDQPLRLAVASGTVPQARLDDMVRRILRAFIATGSFYHPPQRQPIDDGAGGDAVQKVVEEGTVLLRNERDTLPLPRTLRRIAVIGGHADKGVIGGGGSSMVGFTVNGANAVPGLAPTTWPGPVMFHPSSPLQALRKALPEAQIDYASGDDVAAAARLARGAEAVIVFATQWSAESVDLPDITLPGKQDALIAAMAKANPRAVVVLETNGPVAMPWLQQVPAVLEAWYPGIRGGEALARLLLGDVNPSGRLPVTWLRDVAQLPRPSIPGLGFKPAQPAGSNVDYAIEGANVGYRWFAARGLEPLYAFGHGLSYTRFDYANLSVQMDGSCVIASFDVRNSGPREGADVPQLYLRLPQGHHTPIRLVGWDKLTLKPGETRRVSIVAEPKTLADYDPAQRQWRIAAGDYELVLGRSATQAAASAPLRLAESVLPR
ncbi:glycoside hydrolase family 3 C-terminal domain-containing protein [Xanthomonas translucens]|uniref:glycoside hydrolase family 3 C-terminal domain-containing protein n=1 Tax=Xanthomonas campestris pv. translucens TaxID=343 RepID=UPI0009BD1729|nr:glycoside hydrolase family 3 C-terminal domain-containing protein [Xanthomonas translucens]